VSAKPPTIPSLALLLFYSSSQEARFTEEDGDQLHASDLYDMCFRQVYLLREQGKCLVRYVPPGVKLLWKMGKALEEAVIEWLRERGVVKEEQPLLTHEELGIVAHPDIRLISGELTEVKGQDPALFRLSKNEPLIRHRVQCWIYLFLEKATTMRLLSATWGKERNPYRQHIVHYNARIPELLKTAIAPLREAQAGGPLPHRICRSVDDGYARICPVRAECFARESRGMTEPIGQAIERVYGAL
jgi:hypothetical protein